MVSPHSQLKKVTDRVITRSKPTRSAYLARIDAAHGKFPARGALFCANLAHGFAGLEGQEKFAIKAVREPNIGIVSSYNEMLSAHAPYKSFPDIIKAVRASMAVSRNSRASCRRCGRHHAGQRAHGVVAVFARSHCDEHGRRAYAQRVRRGAVPGRVRQDRAGTGDRRTAIRAICRPFSSPPVR